MKTQSEIEKLAEEALSSIDGIQTIEANSFLFTRIQARMDTHRQSFAAVKYLSALSVVLVLFIVLNACTYYFLPNTEPTQTTQQKNTAAQELARQFDLSTSHYSY